MLFLQLLLFHTPAAQRHQQLQDSQLLHSGLSATLVYRMLWLLQVPAANAFFIIQRLSSCHQVQVSYQTKLLCFAEYVHVLACIEALYYRT
jgi:hypothetical protein